MNISLFALSGSGLFNLLTLSNLIFYLSYKLKGSYLETFGRVVILQILVLVLAVNFSIRK